MMLCVWFVQLMIICVCGFGVSVCMCSMSLVFGMLVDVGMFIVWYLLKWCVLMIIILVFVLSSVCIFCVDSDGVWCLVLIYLLNDLFGMFMLMNSLLFVVIQFVRLLLSSCMLVQLSCVSVVVVCGVRFLLFVLLNMMIGVLWCGIWVYVLSLSFDNGKLVVYNGWFCVYGFFLCMLISVILLWVSRCVCMFWYDVMGKWEMELVDCVMMFLC